jgi:uncharacterized membrane protein
MWTFLFLIILAIVFGQKLSTLRQENQRLAQRIADLHLEIDASRRAFLKRVEQLERGVIVAPAPEAELPLIVEEPAEPVAADTPPVVSETPAEAPLPETEAPPVRWVPPPPRPETEVPVYAPPAAARSGIEWERLIGVRGAALLGAIVLGLAALLFLQYSIEHGLIPPIVRVAIGFLVGAAAIVVSELLRKRGYLSTANALAGGGVIVLYASTWAAKNLYGFIDIGLAFALMSLTTAVCGLLSWRHSAREIAFLGLAGGFATPLLLCPRRGGTVSWRRDCPGRTARNPTTERLACAATGRNRRNRCAGCCRSRARAGRPTCRRSATGCGFRTPASPAGSTAGRGWVPRAAQAGRWPCWL